MNRMTLAATLPLALLLAGCGEKRQTAEPETAEAKTKDGEIALTQRQIATAGIEIVHPTIGEGGGTIELPATIEGDPQGVQAVSAAIGGRVVALTRNLGQPVAKGQTLAIIESREAAQLNGDVAAARARLALASSNLAREQRLSSERVSPEQDLVAARTAATEARIAYDQARAQVTAAGGSGGPLNRLAITAPISGQVISRTAVLGQTVAADAELYRVANLSTVSLSLSLSPADAGRVRPGAAVKVFAAGREAIGSARFVSPALDAQTRLVPLVATLDNHAGLWRVGESVTASIALAGKGGSAVSVPLTAVQTVEGRTMVFVRTPGGFRPTPVELGQQAGDRIIVRTGLTGREAIAAANSFTLKSALGATADED